MTDQELLALLQKDKSSRENGGGDFDFSTAQAVQEDFDFATAQPVEQGAEPQRWGLAGSVPEAAYQAGERNWAGNVFERPAAAIRAGLQALPPGGESPVDAYQRAAVNPTGVPTFKDLMAQRAIPRPTGNPILDTAQALSPTSMTGTTLGMTADVATSPPDAILALLGMLPGVQRAGASLAGSPAGRAVGQFMTKERHLPSLGRPAIPNTEALLQIPEEQVPRLPQKIREMYLSARRTQIGTEAQEAKSALRLLHGQTKQQFADEIATTQANLQDQAYQAALRLKQVDARPLLKAQSDRYKQLAGDAVADAQARGISFRPKQLKEVLERTFKDEPRAFNIAHEQLGLSGLANDPTAVYTPEGILGAIDNIGLGVKRTGTSTYAYEDLVADRLRSALIDEMGNAGVKSHWIKEAKDGWAAWKPIQKRLVRETRLFEDTDIVSDKLVQDLMKHALSDESPNSEAFFGSLRTYLGKEIADPMKPTVARLSALERKQVAIEAAKIAEEERIRAQVTGATQQLGNLELSVAQKVERAKRIWGVVRRVGGAGAILYGGVKLLD